METTEMLWGTPESVRERLSLEGRDAEWTEFVLCGIYCAVAVTFLVIFGIAAIVRGELPYATVILGFAVATCLIYGSIWFSGSYHLARHFVVTLMGTLCVFLFYSGGTDNTGPLYFFIFPIVAVFLQGFRTGSISVVALLFISLLLLETGLLGFDRQRYDFVFMSRVLTIYLIIAILSALFAWFRETAERELLLSREDLENITHADMLTGLANRQFMDRLIRLEFARFKRYGSVFCLMAMKIDGIERIRNRYGTQHTNKLLSGLSLLLMQTLRTVDTPARWDADTVLIMLPESTLEGASLMAQRIRAEIKKHVATIGPTTVSIGISDIGEKPDEAIFIAEQNLDIASRDKGDSIISGRQTVPPGGASPGLSTYFREKG